MNMARRGLETVYEICIHEAILQVAKLSQDLVYVDLCISERLTVNCTKALHHERPQTRYIQRQIRVSRTEYRTYSISKSKRSNNKRSYSNL